MGNEGVGVDGVVRTTRCLMGTLGAAGSDGWERVLLRKEDALKGGKGSDNFKIVGVRHERLSSE